VLKLLPAIPSESGHAFKTRETHIAKIL